MSYGIELYRIARHNQSRYRMVSNGIVWYRMVSYGIVSHDATRAGPVLCSVAQHCGAVGDTFTYTPHRFV